MVSITRLSNDKDKTPPTPQGGGTRPHQEHRLARLRAVIELDRRLGLRHMYGGWLWRRTVSLLSCRHGRPWIMAPTSKESMVWRSPVGPHDRSDARACARDACANTINAGAT